MRFSRLLTLCGWCSKLLGWSDPVKANCTGVSHGICATCAGRYFQQHTQPRPNERRTA